MKRMFSIDDSPRMRINYIKEFLKTLFNHRAIIRELQEDKRNIEINAKDIFNMLSRAGCGMVISEDKKGFLYTIMITNGVVNAYRKSEVLVPPKYAIEQIMTQMKEFILKGKKKEKENVQANTKGQTDNKKEQPDSDKD